MDEPPDLDALYKEARAALTAKDLPRAAALLKQILLTDENYKDASKLLAQVVPRKHFNW